MVQSRGRIKSILPWFIQARFPVWTLYSPGWHGGGPPENT